MAIDYAKVTNPGATPQSEPLPGQVKNSAGGHAYRVDDWKQLERFLILGTEGNTYYAAERKVTQDNARAVLRCIAADGARAVSAIAEVSHAGRAPKNDPSLFALALACRHGDEGTKRQAYAALPVIARTGTHLFHWASYMKTLGGVGGNGAKRAVARWYNEVCAADVALQVVKYQQRDGWSHRDLLRLAHPEPATPQHAAIFDYAAHGWQSVGEQPHDDVALRVIWAHERAKTARGADLVRLIRDHRLPHECVPNDAKGDPAVWEAMLPSMGVTAMVRNLGKMTAVGALAPLSSATALVCEALTDIAKLRRGRVHPLQLLQAQVTYAQGHGDKGKLSWKPVDQVVAALDRAFYAAFGAVERTGKRWFLGVDISGSMDSGAVAGMPGITPRVGAAAMALVTAGVEEQHFIAGFEATLTPLAIRGHRLGDVVDRMQRMHMGSTDCAQPMLYALAHKMPVDAFVCYTDSETWCGDVHPVQALRKYREKMGIDAKLIVVGMVANEFSIADPTDAGMLDVVGFDAAAPAVMADFARG